MSAGNGGRGPAPKDPSKRQRTNVDPVPETQIPRSARVLDPPPLPERPPEQPWHERTVEWYGVWCASPQATVFLKTDWQRLHMLADIVDAYIRGRLPLISEIRQTEAMLGATCMDRLRLRWRIVEDEVAEPPKAKRSSKDPRLALVQ